VEEEARIQANRKSEEVAKQIAYEEYLSNAQRTEEQAKTQAEQYAKSLAEEEARLAAERRAVAEAAVINISRQAETEAARKVSAQVIEMPDNKDWSGVQPVTEVFVNAENNSVSQQPPPQQSVESSARVAGNYAKELAEETSAAMENIIDRTERVEMETVGSGETSLVSAGDTTLLTKKQSRLKKILARISCNIL